MEEWKPASFKMFSFKTHHHPSHYDYATVKKKHSLDTENQTEIVIRAIQEKQYLHNFPSFPADLALWQLKLHEVYWQLIDS